ncbi:MAG: hypothetical protein KF863_21365 [Rubrivivax sp.]|nr:hypothetical protein [Rubrivivax sp.]
MASVGAAAARGLESGFNLGLRMQADQRSEEDRQRRQRLQDEQLGIEREDRQLRLEERQRGIDERARAQLLADEDRALAAVEAQIATQRDEGAALFQQYGAKVPRHLAEPYARRSEELRAERHRLLEARWQPHQRRVQDLISRVQTGQVQLQDRKPEEVFEVLAVSARRDPRDLIGGEDGSPSKVSAAMRDFVTGLETENEGMMLDSANVLFEPELKVGVGEDSPHGGKILGKRIVKFLPHPQDPSQVLPVVKVYVGRGDGKGVKADPDAPKGATGYYFAPITEGRSSDPNDPIAAIPMQRGMEYLGQLQTLSEAVNASPALRARVLEGAAGQDKQPSSFLSSFLANGGKLPAPPKVSRERVDLGSHVLERDVDETGNVTGERKLVKGLSPSASDKGGPSQRELEIRRAVEQGLMTEEEGRKALRDHAMGLKPGDAAKADKLSAKEQASRAAALAQADRVIGKVDEAAKLVGGWTTGVVGALMQKLPASERRDLMAALDTIKANLGFAELQAMREASPTGGALGQVAVQELIALQSTIASLDVSQSAESLKRSLAQVRKHYDRYRELEQRIEAEEAAGAAGAPPPPPVGTVMDGYRFTGGNPADPKSWEPVGQQRTRGATGSW